MAVSVCIATYNGERFIADQLNSILSQLGPEDEVIISDDSSSDQTVDIIRSLNDERIRIYKNQHFRSPIFNFEHALKYARHELIFMSDQDDLWLPGKVAYYKERLKSYDLVMTDCTLIDDNRNMILESYFDLKNSGKGILKNLFKNTYMGCCIGFNKKMLKYILPFPASVPMHDIWIGITAELTGKVTFDKHVFLYHRRHHNNASTTGQKTRSGILKLFLFRWNIIRYIPLILWRKWVTLNLNKLTTN